MILAALNQVPVDAHMRAARSLGYGRGVAWIKVILPQVYPQIRLPVLAVLVFSLSVVDMALILGPDHPPTLGVLVLQWLMAPDVTSYLPGAAGAVLLLSLTVGVVVLWRGAESGRDRHRPPVAVPRRPRHEQRAAPPGGRPSPRSRSSCSPRWRSPQPPSGRSRRRGATPRRFRTAGRSPPGRRSSAPSRGRPG